MTARVVFEAGPGLALLFGFQEEHLRRLEAALGVTLTARGNEVAIRGPRGAVQAASKVLEKMRDTRAPVAPEALAAALPARPGAAAAPSIRVPRQTIATRGPRQGDYVRAIRTQDVVFGLGPAGTGKTYLAVACALEALLAQSVERIILARPVVEAGERLGFLPGDVQEKVNPYMRPLHDALQDMVDPPTLRRLVAEETVEIAPLAYMRGRTLHKAFIILDEAQNTTAEQMKMFLTRLGPGSKAVVTGDTTQIDLPRTTVSGLVDAVAVLGRVPGIGIVRFRPDDVVRHEMVARIVSAYERRDGSGVSTLGRTPVRHERRDGSGVSTLGRTPVRHERRSNRAAGAD